MLRKTYIFIFIIIGLIFFKVQENKNWEHTTGTINKIIKTSDKSYSFQLYYKTVIENKTITHILQGHYKKPINNQKIPLKYMKNNPIKYELLQPIKYVK